MSARVPILMYHEVTPTPVERYRKYTVTPAELASQLAWLRSRRYTSVDLDAVHAAFRGQGKLPPRPVVITFDDGSRDCLEHAVPALLAHGFTATFFIVGGLVGALEDAGGLLPDLLDRPLHDALLRLAAL